MMSDDLCRVNNEFTEPVNQLFRAKINYEELYPCREELYCFCETLYSCCEELCGFCEFPKQLFGKWGRKRHINYVNQYRSYVSPT